MEERRGLDTHSRVVCRLSQPLGLKLLIHPDGSLWCEQKAFSSLKQSENSGPKNPGPGFYVSDCLSFLDPGLSPALGTCGRACFSAQSNGTQEREVERSLPGSWARVVREEVRVSVCREAEAGHLHEQACRRVRWGGGSERVSKRRGLRPGGGAWESFLSRSLFCKLDYNFYLLEKDVWPVVEDSGPTV